MQAIAQVTHQFAVNCQHAQEHGMAGNTHFQQLIHHLAVLALACGEGCSVSTPPELPCLLQAQPLKVACNGSALLLQQSPDCADGAPVVQDLPVTALPMLPPTGHQARVLHNLCTTSVLHEHSQICIMECAPRC